MQIKNIDNKKDFDFGNTSNDYAKFRDIYPLEFYDMILSRGLCKDGQNVLDVGTGTGVIPLNMYKYNAKWTGIDISENQIAEAKNLAKASNLDINFFVSSAEKIDFPKNTFDVITACQCIPYFNHKETAPLFAKILKKGGSFLILYMGFLPFEDKLVDASEKLVLKYNPYWSGYGDTKNPIRVPDEYKEFFEIVYTNEFDVKVPFTRESWHGRMRACRGVGASMTKDVLALWDKEHKKMLESSAGEKFFVSHYIAVAQLKVKK